MKPLPSPDEDRSSSFDAEAAPSGDAAPTDTSLLRRLRRGDEDAATRLYLRYERRLRGLAQKQMSKSLDRHVDPEDIVQSVFRCFFRGVHRGLYEVPDGEELWKLLLVIALNKIREKGAYFLADKRDVRRTTLSPERLRSIPGPQEQALAELQLAIQEIFATLTASERSMVELRIEGHQVAEIASKTGRSKRMVERVLQQFRSTLDSLIHEA